MSNVRKIGLIVGALAMTAAARATGPDLTAVTDAITDTKGSIVTAATIAVGAGLALMAIKFGGRWLVKVWKSFSS